MVKKSILILFLALFTFPSFLSAQGYKENLVPLRNGVAWLYSNPEGSVYFHYLSDSIYETGTRGLVLIEGKLFRSFLFLPDPPINKSNKLEDAQKSYLKDYLEGRMAVFRSAPGSEIGEVKPVFSTLRGRIIMEWIFKTPNDPNVLGHVFLSTICHDGILSLNRPIREGESIKSARILLRKLASTLQTPDKPIGAKELSEKLSSL